MARYRIAHYPKRDCWIAKNPDGTFYWREGEDAHKEAYTFPNYREAKAALYSLPDEKLMYGFSYREKVHFMKSYDSDGHYEREQEYLANKRLLRQWGH